MQVGNMERIAAGRIYENSDNPEKESWRNLYTRFGGNRRARACKSYRIFGAGLCEEYRDVYYRINSFILNQWGSKFNTKRPLKRKTHRRANKEELVYGERAFYRRP